MKKRETLIYTILLGSSLLLCPLRSTAQEKKTATTEEKATVPLYQGTYVGLDVFGLGSKIFGSDFTSAEVSVEVNLKNRFIPIIEIGYGHTDTTDDETNIHYKASAPYFRIGMNYNILFKKHINVGIAVSLNDGNLIVPVVHDADHLNLNGLAVAIDSLALKARDNKLMPEDIDGGTFTITNFGTFKSLFGTPIINQPQVAILGVGFIEKKPAVVETPEGDTIAIRHKMYLSLSYDHRIINGALGGEFLRRVADYLENWDK